jgi:hypothetical protein
MNEAGQQMLCLRVKKEKNLLSEMLLKNAYGN